MWNAIGSWRTQIQPWPTLAISASHDQVKVGGLGFAVLTAYKSKPHAPPVTATQIQRREPLQEEELVMDASRLSGSDVLSALQQAATRKKKKAMTGRGKKKSKIGSTLSAGSDVDREENDVHSSLKPLMIKSDWGKRIEDLETRLQELSEI